MAEELLDMLLTTRPGWEAARCTECGVATGEGVIFCFEEKFRLNTTKVGPDEIGYIQGT